MKYRATIDTEKGKVSKIFDSAYKAALWIESNNGIIDGAAVIEKIEEEEKENK